jgi:hypothetical protein
MSSRSAPIHAAAALVDEIRQAAQVRRHHLEDVVHLAGQRALPAPPAAAPISFAKRCALLRLCVASVTVIS